MKICLSYIFLLFSCQFSAIGQPKTVAINFQNDSTNQISVTLIGLDTSNINIINHDYIKIDFNKNSVYKIKLKTKNISLTIDSIREDINSVSIFLDKKSPLECSYYIERGNPLIATMTDCLGQNCKHKIIAYTDNGKLPVLWLGQIKGYRGPTKYFIGEEEISEEEFNRLKSKKRKK